MKKYLFVLALGAVFVVPGIILAAEELKDTPTDYIMEEVVVTATRDKEEIRKVPANVTVITAKDIRGSGAASIVDLLKRKANIHVREYNGNPNQAIVDLRGFGGDNPYGKTLVLLDGRRMNRPDMSSINWLQVPLQLIDRIEIVRGTNTAMYGDSAVSGVINIITKKGTLESKYDFSTMIGENGTNIERAGTVGKKGKVSYAANGEYQSSDGWRERTRYRSKGGGLNVGYDFSDRFSITADTSYNKTTFKMPGSLTKEEMAVNRTQKQPARSWPVWWGTATSPAHTDDEAVNEYFNGNILVEASFGNAGDFEMNLSYGNKEIITDQPSGWSPGQYNHVDIDTIGITPKYILESKISNYSNKFIAGIDVYEETLSLGQFLDKERTRHAWDSEVKKDSLGYYVRDEISPRDEWIFGVGYRQEKAKYEGRKTKILGGGWGSAFALEEKTHREDAFDIDLSWLPTKQTKIFGKFSTTYRFPFVDEQVSHHGLADGFNQLLNPEEGKSYEIGGNYSFKKGFKVGLALFQIDMKDEIVWDNTLNRNVNQDETKHRGMEVSLSYNKENLFDLFVNYAYHKAELEKGEFTGKELPFAPNHHLSAGMDITLPHGFHLCPDMLYVSDSYLGNDLDNSSEKLDSFSVYNLVVRCQPNFERLNPTIFFGVKNIFDKEYSTIGFEEDPANGAAPDNVYYPSNGREFIGGISFNF
ncbi:MAG: TonB-dependent receptor [Deltaproteobacteria bacterium]|nr:TonB-dependent receptor [Deltaproteobacteria bacterium]